MCNCGNKRQSFNTEQKTKPKTTESKNDVMHFSMKMEYTPVMYSGNNIIVARGIFSGRKYRFQPDVKTMVEKRDAAALLGIAGMFVSV
jgi:hypothetical protein